MANFISSISKKNEQHDFYNSQCRKLMVKSIENILGKTTLIAKEGRRLALSELYLWLAVFFPYILFHVFIFQNSYKKYVLSQFYFISFFKDFIRCGPFLKSSLNLLQYCFCFMFYFYLVTRHEGS